MKAHPTTKETRKMNVSEAMAAYRDGTFQAKAKDSAEHRQKTAKPVTKGGVQKGRDLYESMHNKKEQ